MAPLDWGLGHATRVVPLIRDLQDKGHEVLIGACGESAVLLKSFFPKLTILDDIPSYGITYPQHGFLSVHFALKSPSILRAIAKEKKWLDRVIDQYNIEYVYSDNRYGLNNKRVECKLITHQLDIPAPILLKPFVRLMTGHYFDLFDQILVPDFNKGMNLSGKLSHGRDITTRVKYIGPLSRFNGISVDKHTAINQYQCVALISGPEPTRTYFEEILRREIAITGLKALIIQGKPSLPKDTTEGNVRTVNHLPDDVLASVLKQAGLIISRSGYSTIMDLHALDLQAMLVPTPGQAEQVYLAEYHHTANKHLRVRQNELTAERILQTRKRLNFAAWSTQKLT